MLSPESRRDLAEKSSLLRWFPVVKKLDIPMPETIVVEIPADPKEIRAAADKLGYPVFMKTDLIAAKHHWTETCFLEQGEYLDSQLMNLIDCLECIDMEAGSPLNAIVFREYIELESAFKAFQGMPVARERRYFVDKGKVKCHHHYWIESAISFWGETKEPKGWKKMLKKLNEETEQEINILSQYAQIVADVMKEDWAVDFAQARDGTWYLIDMQRSLISWHPECKFKMEV